jgi:membrane protein YdbS with pleckstrin-like domain
MREPATERAATDRPGLVAVDRYLLPREVQVATVRQHPAVLIGPSAAALGGALVAGVLATTVLSGNTPVLLVLLVLELILVARLVWKAANWAVDYFVVTSQRLLLTTGLLTRNVSMMPLTKVTDMRFQRSFAGRLFGYGEFIVESAGAEQALRNIPFIPYPEQLYLLICGMIFPDSADEPDDSDEEDFGEDQDGAGGFDTGLGDGAEPDEDGPGPNWPRRNNRRRRNPPPDEL